MTRLQSHHSDAAVAHRPSGESAGIDPAVIRRGHHDAAEVIKGYSVSDVYNLDETGLFFRMLPDRSLTTKDTRAQQLLRWVTVWPQ